MKKEIFLKQLKEYEVELLKNGVDKSHIKLLAASDGESEFHRKASYSRFVRFARRMGLDIATPEEKLRWIKTVDVKQFMDIISVSNGLLRGFFRFERWNRRKKIYGTIVGPSGEVELCPPDNPEIEFARFFGVFQKQITIQNMKQYAVMLYMALIFAHVFPDGNGRISRIAYFIITSNGLPDINKINKRNPGVHRMCEKLGINVRIYLQKLGEKPNCRADEKAENESLVEKYGEEP